MRDGYDHRDQHEQHHLSHFIQRSALSNHKPDPGWYYGLC